MPPDKIDGVTNTKSGKARYFYGWNIVAATFLADLSYAEHYTSILGFFFKPLQNEFGWKRSAIAAVQTIARVTEALVAPVVGPLIDRYGPRVLMPIGGIVVGLAMLAVTQVDAIWQFYLLRGVIVALGFAFMGRMVTDVAINNWFVQKRGRALAIGRLGGNISSIIFIPISVFVIAASGWRTMFVIFAVVTFLVVLVPSAVLMRRRPEDMGLHPDGESKAPNLHLTNDTDLTEATAAPEPVWNRREVLTTKSFWLLVLCFGIDNMALQGLNISLAPYIQDLGYGDTTLAAVTTFRAIIMAALLPLMGFVAEHTHRVPVRVAPFIIQGVGSFLFLLAGQPVFLWLAVALYGMGGSALGVITEVIWANYFGRLSLGLVRSLGYLIAFGFGAFGPVAMSAVFDLMGTYRPAFGVLTGVFLAAAVVIGIVRPPTARRYATATEMSPSRRSGS
ncbi:MAG: MFS transporter [Chloroflexi bacterium]|nr:MFS transporter [Chloroflexota bacterium]